MQILSVMYGVSTTTLIKNFTIVHFLIESIKIRMIDSLRGLITKPMRDSFYIRGIRNYNLEVLGDTYKRAEVS